MFAAVHRFLLQKAAFSLDPLHQRVLLSYIKGSSHSSLHEIEVVARVVHWPLWKEVFGFINFLLLLQEVGQSILLVFDSGAKL